MTVSDRALLGGGLAGLLALPLVVGALLTGGLLVAGLVLLVAAALAMGLPFRRETSGRECLRCGTDNDAEVAVCATCGAQL